MTAPRAVIVGTGRSGSGYIAALLGACGIDTGHERYWTLGDEQPRQDLDLDSSWIAAPDVLGGDTYDGLVLHQVRHPLAVVSSLVANPDHGPWLAERERVLGPLPDAAIDAAMTVAAGWLDLCDHDRVSYVWQVEQVTPARLVHICDVLGHRVAFDDAARAWLRVGRSTNDHGTTGRLTWGDLPDGKLKTRLLYHAEKNGYPR